MLFIEFDKGWFDNEYDQFEDRYEFSDQPYSQLVDKAFDVIQVSSNGITPAKVKLQYPDGSQLLLADEVIKYKDNDLVFYDFEGHVWRHRYVIGLHHKTEEGLKIVDEILTMLREHPAFMEINPSIVLMGEVGNAQHCVTCG